MAEREMHTAVESQSTTPPGMTPYQLLTGKKPDLSLARVWGCMVEFMVPKQQRAGKLVPKARWGLHLGVSPESKGWEVLGLTNNKVVTSVEVIFYETLLLEVWKAKHGRASGRTLAHPPTDTSTATVPLLAEFDEPADEDVVEVLPPSPVLAPPFPVANRPALTSVLATGDEGSLEALPVAPASGIAGGRQGAKLVDQFGKPSTTGEQQTREPVEQEAAAGVQPIGELSKLAGGKQLVEGLKQLFDDLAVDEEGELSAGEDSTDSDVVEVPITKLELQCMGRTRRRPERLSFHTCLPPAAFTTVYDEVDDDLLYDDAEEDEELPELDPDVHADKHRRDIATMTVKEVMVIWKGEAVKATMVEEIRSLIGMGSWELVECPRGVNIMKNQWVLTTKYRIDDTVEHEKARLVVKDFTQVCGANYDETYSPVGSYLLKSLYGLKQSPLLWYRALDGVLLGAGWKKSQVDDSLYFKASNNRVTCWVLVYIDDLLATSNSPAMLKELKELLEATFELREISPVVKRFIDEEQGGRVPKTPVLVDAYAELTFDDKEAQEREEEEYRQKVGSLHFAATTTRPDIAFACSKLGSGLMSEYVAATDAGKEGRRLSFLLAEFKLLDDGKQIVLRVDNKSAITVAEGLGLTGNLKHVERRYAWVQHMVRCGKFIQKYTPTTEQPADFLTKALHFPAFNRCSVAIGKVRLADVGNDNDDVQQ
ncbi:unnamed protein product [Closterium sp. NIES-54]